MWDKIKKWFGFLDVNHDGKFTAEDAVVAQAIAETKVNAVNDQITDAVTQVKKRVKRVKEEVADVVEAAKDVAGQAEDVVKAVKGKARAGRKKK